MISFFNISYRRNNKKLFSHYWWVWLVTPDYRCDPDYYPVTSWWHSVFTPATQQHNYQSGSMIDWFGILPFFSKTKTELLQYFFVSFRCSTISINYPFSLSLHENFNQSWTPLDPVPHIFDQGCGSGSGRIWCFSLDPDPVFNFLWIRIRFQPRFWNKKKNCRKVSKSDLSEENLKFMTKDRQKMKKATISY